MPFFITDDGVPIFFVDRGKPPSTAILLIHGETFNSRFWKHNIAPLAQHCRVVAPDLRGRGESGKTEDGQSIAQFARDIDALAEHLGLSQILLVGWSLGSAVGWSYIAQFGQSRLRGFVNVDQLPYRHVSEEQLEAAKAAVRENRFRNHLAKIDRYFGAGSEPDEETRMWMASECMKTHSASHLAIVADSHRCDFRPVLPTIVVPNQVYWASHGAITQDTLEQITARTDRCEPVFFEGCGHLIPWVRPEEFNARLLSFATRVGV